MSIPSSRAHQENLLHKYHHLLSIFSGSRRRKILCLIAVAFTLALFLFARQTYSSRDASVHHLRPPSRSPGAIALPEIDSASSVVTEADPVVFTFIMWSESSALEGALLLKSILLYSSRPSDIHIICDAEAENILRHRFSLISRPFRPVRVWFYRPSWQAMLDRIDREGSIQTDHAAGLPGLMKLFIHEIIPPTVKKSIYVDTDALFISDPVLLWDVFESLRSTTAVVMGSHPEQDAPEWHYASRICSCVMLLDLEKLRSLRLMDSSLYHDLGGPKALSPQAFKAKYGLPGEDGKGRYNNVRLGDQGYWWAIVDYYPDMFEPLSYDFEVTSCLLDAYLTGLGNELTPLEDELSRLIHIKGTPQEGKVVLPKLLHLYVFHAIMFGLFSVPSLNSNCLHGADVYMDWPGWSDPSNGLNMRWGAALAYHRGFKWIWLNQGKDTNSLQLLTVDDVVFADQLEASRQTKTWHS